MTYYGKEEFEANARKLLRNDGEIVPISAALKVIPSVPNDGVQILEMLYEMWGDASSEGDTVNMIKIGSTSIDGDLLIGNTENFGLKAIICEGSLSISGDFYNENAEANPALIVMGDLKVGNWLRGGMPCFVGGNVHASGVIVGEYEDGPLFVGGGLSADNGYIKRIKPYPDLPDIKELHQIAGEIKAKTLDLCKIKDFDKDLKKYLTSEATACYSGDGAESQGAEGLIALSKSGTPIWR